MSHPLLASLNDLEEQGLAWVFLAQFAPQPIELQITVGGALGVMTFAWRPWSAVDAPWSEPLLSEPTAMWAVRVAEAFVDLTWNTATYAEGSTYRVTAGGAVIPDPSAALGLSAARYDLRIKALEAATDLALSWMAPRVKPPLLAWGHDVRARTAHVACYLLKSQQGFAPTQALVGDDNVRVRYADAEAWFKAVGQGTVTPQDLIDSSPGGSGRTLALAPTSEAPRGW